MLVHCQESCDKVRFTADKDSNCQTWARQGLCVDAVYSGHMATNCPESCASLYTQNSYPECAQWAERGDCSSNPRMMMVTCAKSCQDQLRSLYIDIHPLCHHWAEKGECMVNPRYMLSTCERACYDHVTSDELLDVDQDCQERLDECVHNARNMRYFCEKTCSDLHTDSLLNKPS